MEIVCFVLYGYLRYVDNDLFNCFINSKTLDYRKLEKFGITQEKFKVFFSNEVNIINAWSYFITGTNDKKNKINCLLSAI
jgi:hypothetical protein